MKQVLVVESGAKTRTIKGFLGGEYDVVACGGHIVDLPDDELGINISDDFDFQVVPINLRGGNAVESLKSKLEAAETVYLATDPDREGEAIAADIRDFAVPSSCTHHRIEFNAIVYPVVMEALENPREVNEDRVEAQRARRSLDRLVGFILSSITKFDPDGPGVPSVGRVQSPAVRLVVDREREIDNFEPRRYWTIQGRITSGNGGKFAPVEEAFEVTFEGEWDEFEVTKDVIESLTGAGFMTVESCDVDPESEQNPLPPYTTDALQNDADYLLDLSPERTMELAQQLYEGVNLSGSNESDETTGENGQNSEGDGETDESGETKALITYMRTDSTRVSPSSLNLAKEALARRDDLGEEMYAGRTWQANGQAQDAHEAIRPTQPEEPATWPENLEGKLPEPMVNLYELIFKRFLASQMVPAIYRTTTLSLTARDQEATAVGHELLDPGFLRVWGEIRPGHQRDLVTVPELTPGTHLPLDRTWPEPQETQPPARYREGSLVSELKDRGIGRPSTYGDILTKIKRGPRGFGYVRKSGRSLRPTKKGEALIEYLETEYPRIVDYDYTARMEDDLDRIEAGELSYQTFLQGEFNWLHDAYELANEKGWLESDRPTPVQLNFLESLAKETAIEIPDEVFSSKSLVSDWIDKLQDEIDPYIRLTDIHEAEVNGIDVHRFRLYFNEPLPEEEYQFLNKAGLQYKRGDNDRLPSFQFQRQDRDQVEALWGELRDRYESTQALNGFKLELGGSP